jgi:cyclopropane-fatty-acyl-phospholipid synthase
MTTAMGRDSRLFVQDVEDLSTHYAETLRQWRERFLSEHERVLALGFDERFVRRWEFYLAYCEGAFLARYLGDLQLVLARPMNANLGTAPYAGPHVALGEADVDAAMSREGR